MTTPCSIPDPKAVLPTTRVGMEARGWDEVDVVFVSGDACIDHPSFAAALFGSMRMANRTNSTRTAWIGRQRGLMKLLRGLWRCR